MLLTFMMCENYRLPYLTSNITLDQFVDKLTEIVKSIDGDIDEKQFKIDLKDFIKTYSISIGVGMTAVALIPIVLGIIGFGSVGIISGSMAASWQAAIGNVIAGSLFSALQAVGMAGFSLATKIIIGFSSGTFWHFFTNYWTNDNFNNNDSNVFNNTTCNDTNFKFVN